MKEKPSLPDSALTESLNSCYGIQVAALTFLALGADPDASLYRARRTDGTSYFVKLKRGRHHDSSVAVVELLQRAGIEEVIAPIRTIGGEPTQRIEDFTLVVYPFVEGQDGFHRRLTESQWVKLGKALKACHEIDVPQSIKRHLRKEEYSPKWRKAVRSLYAHLSLQPVDEAAAELIEVMKGQISAIRRLVERSEELAEMVRGLPTRYVLCHSDIHAGNVLLGEKESIYIVDWDDPIIAPKERDLMFIGGGVGNVWNRPHEESLFYQGYGKTQINPALLSYYRHERIVEDIAIYGEALLLKKSGGEDRPVMVKHFTEMFTPRGVVDIALNTEAP